MAAPADRLGERQPLMQPEGDQPPRSTSGAAPQPSDAAPTTPTPPPPADLAGARATAPSTGHVPVCRYCLEEEDEGSLEAPCSCAGTMRWAHHDCVQRWVDEKHDKRCEVCGSQFQGAFRDPPPRPPSHPLVAQLQVDNNDNRIVLLADPSTGAIVARVVMPPGEGLQGLPANLGGGPAGWERWRVPASADAPASDGGDEEQRTCGPLGVLGAVSLLLLVLVFMLLTIQAAAAEGGGSSAAAAGAGAWLVRIMLLSAWICVRFAAPRVSRRPGRGVRHAAFLDLEAGGAAPAMRRAGPPRP